MMHTPADDQQQPQQQPPVPVARGAVDASRLPVLDSGQLFEGQRELIILHQGEQYRLRITRQEKLILTK